MDISEELKERFCRDCCIPINIYSEPIFASRIQLYDRFYNTIERYNIFLKMITERYTSYELQSTATINTLKYGEANIYATSISDPTKIGVCHVDVSDPTDYNVIQSVTLNQSELYVAAGGLRTLRATLTPVGAYDDGIIWETSDPNIATVTAGAVRGYGTGKCTITAYSNKDKSKSASCTVNVTKFNPPQAIKLQVHSTRIEVGKRETLSFTIEPKECTHPNITWTSSDESVATVSGSGVVSGLQSGYAIITAKATYPTGSTVCDTCVVYSDNTIRVVNVLLNKSELHMRVGGQYTLIASVYPDVATDKTIKWTSSNIDVATVNEKTGLITAIGVGDTIITATSTDVYNHAAKCALSVSKPLDVRYVNIDPSQLPKIAIESDIESKVNPDDPLFQVVSPSQTFELTANISVGYDVNPEIKWRSNNPSVVEVTSGSAEPTLKSSTIHYDHYYSDWDNIRCKLVNYIRNCPEYIRFCNEDTSRWSVRDCICMRSSIYTKDLDGHTMVGVKIDKPLFTSLFYYDPGIFVRNKYSSEPTTNPSYCNTWEDFVSYVGETDNQHIIYSENLLKEVMCCCNQSRIEVYGAYLLSQFYVDRVKPVIQSSRYENLPKLVYFGRDEFVIDVTSLVNVTGMKDNAGNISNLTNRLMKFYYEICQRASSYFCSCTDPSNVIPTCNCTYSPDRPFPMTVRLFTLYKLKTEHADEEGIMHYDDSIDGYIENIYYEGNQPLEFVETDPCQLPILMRSMSYQELQENDRKFMHRGLMAQFTDDYKIHIPPISVVPDLPKILAEMENSGNSGGGTIDDAGDQDTE